MIATNALLSIAFSIMANFTNLVAVPGGPVPRSVADLSKWVVGSPSFPTETILFDKRGRVFDVLKGSVVSFSSPSSFFGLQDANEVGKFVGTSLYDTNQIVNMASNVLSRLLKNGNPLTNGPAKVVLPGLYKGNPIPFYRVQFPRDRAGQGVVAEVEIDGRNGGIVFLSLWDQGFYDLAEAQAIESKVYMAEAPVERRQEAPGGEIHLEKPTPEYVSAAITNCLGFLRVLGVPLGSQTNLGDIDWSNTFFITNKLIAADIPIARIAFVNGPKCQVFNGTVITYLAADACFTVGWTKRSAAEWAPFSGKIAKNWGTLATNLQQILIEKMGISKNALAKLEPMPQCMPPEEGTVGMKRLLVEWRNWPAHPGRSVSLEESTLAFMTEFDLESGELKIISFFDRDLIEQLGASRTGATKGQR